MYRRPSNLKTVTLMLHGTTDNPWQLQLSEDCLRFIGRYKRVEGFHVDAIMLFEGLRKSG